MNPARSAFRPRVRGIALLAGTALLAAAVPAAAAPATTPAGTGDHVLAVFNGAVRSIVLVSDRGHGDARIWITTNQPPNGAMRLVGSSAACSSPLTSANRVFSRKFSQIGWVRTTVPGILGEEGAFQLRSLRFIRPASGAQVACRPVRAYRNQAPTATPALFLEDVLVTSYIVSGGTRGMIVVGPGLDPVVPIKAVIQGVGAVGTMLRLVGSTEACGRSHQASETVFDRTLSPTGFTDGGVTDTDSWDSTLSLRLFRGAGFSHPAGCLQDNVLVVNEVL